MLITRMQPRRGGFTLFEVLVVLMMVSIVAGMSVLTLTAYAQTYQLDLAAQEIITQLRLARYHASSERARRRLTFVMPRTIIVERESVLGGWTLERTALMPAHVRYRAGSSTFTSDQVVVSTAGVADRLGELEIEYVANAERVACVRIDTLADAATARMERREGECPP
ncbi:MAG: prepilin-type N-terminal cleavage/methylation domain-containing protein [Candidatus Schekmanbacteria bacterium]|nr:prepilin-type N-terminal cleavage/methylation domain-containing protein [Candidatus Schekmanbacteria bacterium]